MDWYIISSSFLCLPSVLVESCPVLIIPYHASALRKHVFKKQFKRKSEILLGVSLNYPSFLSSHLFSFSSHVEVRFIWETTASSRETHVSLLGWWWSYSWMAGLLRHALPAGGRMESATALHVVLFCGYFPTNISFNFQRKGGGGDFKEMTQRGSLKSFSQTVKFRLLKRHSHSKQSKVCVCFVFTSLTPTWLLLTIISLFAAKHFVLLIH